MTPEKDEKIRKSEEDAVSPEAQSEKPETPSKDEDKPDKTMVTAQEEALTPEAASGSGAGAKEEKTVMLESEGTVLKDIVPGKLDVPEKKGTVHIMTGAEAGRKYDIMGAQGAELRVGRDEINDIVIKGEGVSRYHAKFIVIEGGKIKLVDLDSRNGTFVNGKKIKCVLATKT